MYIYSSLVSILINGPGSSGIFFPFFYGPHNKWLSIPQPLSHCFRCCYKFPLAVILRPVFIYWFFKKFYFFQNVLKWIIEICLNNMFFFFFLVKLDQHVGSCLGLIHNIVKLQSQSFRNHPLHSWHSFRPSKYIKKAKQLVNFLFKLRGVWSYTIHCLSKKDTFIVTAGKAFVFRMPLVSSTSPVMKKTACAVVDIWKCIVFC